MNPAAVLSVAIQAKGFEKVSAQLAMIDKQGERSSKSLAAMEGQSKKTGAAAVELERRFSHLDHTVGDFNRSMTGVRNVVGLIKFPALIAGAGAAAKAIGALAAGAVSLLSALGPLAGALAAYPALAAAAGQGLGVLKLATSGLDKAFKTAAQGGKAYQKALQKLTPEQRAFVGTMAPVIKQFKGLRSAAQAGLLPGLTQAVQSASKNVGVLRPIVRDTAKALGELAKRAGDLVGSSGFGKDLAAVGANNVRIISKLGGAALSLFDALRHVVVVAQPLVTWMANLGARWAANIDNAVKLGRESGRLAAFFDRTRQVMTQLFAIAGNLASGFWEIGKAAAPLGRQMLADIVKLTQKFKEWTQSVAGRNTLAQYFRDAKAPLYAIVGLAGDLGAALLRLSKPTDQTTVLAAKLREIVPVLENLIRTTTASLGPALLDALVPIAQVFGDLAGTSGPLVATVQLIGLLATGLHSLLTAVPGLNQLTVFSIGLYGSWKALALVITPLIAVTRAFTVALIGNEAAANTAGLANVRLRLSMIATAAAMKFATVQQWLLNAAMLANPYVAVGAAALAVSAGIVVLYLKVKAFHDWVNKHWPLLLGIFVSPFAGAVILISRHAGQIRDAVVNAFKAMIAAIRALGSTFLGLGGWILDRVVDGVHAKVRAVLNLGGFIKDRLTDGLSAVQRGITGLGGTIMDWIVNGLKAGANKLVGFLNSIIGVVNKLPGVDIGKIKGFATGGVVDQGLVPRGLAHGGAFARTGGMVNRPITMMGEEAPRFPEYVIPTNPAYRKRAQGLLGRAAGALGLAQGGIWSIGELEDLWKSQGGPASVARTMAIVATAESGAAGRYANQFAHNKSGATGLWQILGAVLPGDLTNAAVNARNAIAKWRAGGLGPWVSSKAAWGPLVGGGGGVLGAIGGAFSGAAGAIGGLLAKGAGALLGQLPGTGGLPDWLKGMGGYVLDHVGDWIKGKVSSLLDVFGGGDVSTTGLVPQVQRALKWARSHGWGGSVTSGFRSRSEQAALYQRYLAGGPLAAAPGTSSHEKGQAVDVSDPAGFMRALMNAPANSKLYNRLGAADPVHFSVSGYRKGGVYPYAGSFAQGGVVPGQKGAAAMALVHGGEIIHAAQGIQFGASNLSQYEAGSFDQASALLAYAQAQGDAAGQIAALTTQAIVLFDRITLGQNILKAGAAVDPNAMLTAIAGLVNSLHEAEAGIATLSAPPAAAAADNTAATTDLTDNVSELNDTISRLNDQLDLQRQEALAAQRAYNVSQSQYSVLAKAIADVANGQIGGRVGLGYMTPGFAGGGVRY